MRQKLTAALCLSSLAGVCSADFVWKGDGFAGGDTRSAYSEPNWFDTVTQAAALNNTINPTTAINNNLRVGDSGYALGPTGGPGTPNGASFNMYLGTGSMTVSEGRMKFDNVAGVGVSKSGATTSETPKAPITVNGADNAHYSELFVTFIRNCAVSVNGTGVVTISGNTSSDRLAFSTIDLVGPNATVVFTSQPPSNVISQHLSKFTVGGNPIVLGSDPATFEAGDNAILVASGSGSILTTRTSLDLTSDLYWNASGDGADLYNEANWTNITTSAAADIHTVNPDVAVNRALHVGAPGYSLGSGGGPGVAVGGANANLILGSGSLSVASGTMKFADGVPGGLGTITWRGIMKNNTNYGNTTNVSDPAKAPITISGTGNLDTAFLINCAVTLQDSGTLTLTNDNAGLALNVSTVNLTSGSPKIHYTRIGPAAVGVAANLAKITVNGAAAVVGTDPTTYEPGDDLMIVSDGGAGTIVSIAVPPPPPCGSADFNCDGDIGTDLDIEAFFSCLAGSCPPPPCTSTADFNADGDIGTDADIEAFFRVLAGGSC
jgi:hypothetical protein